TVEEVEAALRRIAPNVALIDVVTSPPGATIYLDRKDLGSRGHAPRVFALPPGKYRVLAELEGHEPAASAEIVADLGKTAHVALTLPRIGGPIRATAEGPVARGAWVHLDDERAPPVCMAPCDVAATPGPHQVYFERERYRGTPRQVVVVA